MWREEFNAAEETEGGHFLRAALPTKLLVKLDRCSMRRRVADVFHHDVKQAAVKDEINDHFRGSRLGIAFFQHRRFS